MSLQSNPSTHRALDSRPSTQRHRHDNMMGGSSAPCASVAPVLLAEAMVDRENNGGTPWDAADSKPGVNYQPPQGAWKDGLCAWRNQLVPSCTSQWAVGG